MLGPVLAGVVLLYALALRSVQRRSGRCPERLSGPAFVAGVAVLGVALLGPLDGLSAQLFSAHMVQHMLLTIVAPPLIALGQPGLVALRTMRGPVGRAVLRTTLGQRPLRQALSALLHPISLVVLVNGVLIAWHAPPIYDAAARTPLLHELEHACFFGSSLLLWLALVDSGLPVRHRLSTEAGLLVLFATWMVGDVFGATLALSERLFYETYASGPGLWGLGPVEDQRLGGALMWFGAGAFYAVVMLCILARPFLRRGARRRLSSSAT